MGFPEQFAKPFGSAANAPRDSLQGRVYFRGLSADLSLMSLRSLTFLVNDESLPDLDSRPDARRQQVHAPVLVPLGDGGGCRAGCSGLESLL